MSILSVDQIQPIGSGTTVTLNATEVKTGTEITVGTGASIFSPAGNTLTFGTSNIERIRIKNDGKIGIGTDNPAKKLEVFDATQGVIRIRGGGGGSDSSRKADLSLFASGAREYVVRADASDAAFKIVDVSGGSERLRITSDGKIGINQSTPTADLEIVGVAGTITTLFLNSATHSASVANESILKFGFNHSGSPDAVGYVKLIETAGNIFDGDMLFGVPYNSGSGGSVTREALRIKSSGQVSISSDGTTDGLLTIKGDSDQVGTPSIRLLDGSDTREVSISNTSGDFVASVHGNDNAIHGHIKMFESGIFSISNGGASGSNTERLRITTDGYLQQHKLIAVSYSDSRAISLSNTDLTTSNFYNTTFFASDSTILDSNGHFVAPVHGIYRLYFRCTTDGGSGNRANVRLRKNGNTINEAYAQAANSGTYQSVSSEIVMELNAGEYLDIQIGQLHTMSGSQHKQVTFHMLG